VVGGLRNRPAVALRRSSGGSGADRADLSDPRLRRGAAVVGDTGDERALQTRARIRAARRRSRRRDVTAEPRIGRGEALGERHARTPAHGLELVRAHEFARRAVGLAGVGLDSSLEARHVRDRLGEFENAESSPEPLRFMRLAEARE